MKTIINFFSGLFNKNFSHAEKSLEEPKETVVTKEEKRQNNEDPAVEEFRKKFWLRTMKAF